MHNQKANTTAFASNEGTNGGEGTRKNANGNGQNPEKTLPVPVPKTPSELLWYLTYYIHILHGMKGITTLGREVLQTAEDMLTGAQGVIRKAVSEIKRREEGELQLRFAVRNAFYGVANISGEDSDSILTAARSVALSVAKQLNLPDAEKYINSLEQEYRYRKHAPTSPAAGGETVKYRITIDGKVASEKCRRNNLELARILYKYGITDGEKSEDCKALGIDITEVKNINDPVEYRVRKKQVRIERIQ